MKKKKKKLTNKNHKKGCTVLNYIEHLFILTSKLLDVFQFLLLLFHLVCLQELRVVQ